MSETVAALGELLASTDDMTDPTSSYVVGQLAAELVASASQLDLSDAIVAVKDSQQRLEPEGASPLQESALAMLSGLLQGVLATQQSTGRTAAPLTVRERVLNLLAIEPQNPTSLANEIGCSLETVSRALTRLRQIGLVEPKENSELDDGRRVTYQLTPKGDETYQLTPKGEKRQDDRFFGQLSDDEGTVSDDDTEAEYDDLADTVKHEDWRAAAINQLGAGYRSNPGAASAQQSR